MAGRKPDKRFAKSKILIKNGEDGTVKLCLTIPDGLALSLLAYDEGWIHDKVVKALAIELGGFHIREYLAAQQKDRDYDSQYTLEGMRDEIRRRVQEI